MTTKAPTIVKCRGSITRLLQSLSTLRGLGRPSTPQDSLLADDRSLPGRIDYLQDHVERFQFCSSPFPRLPWRDTEYADLEMERRQSHVIDESIEERMTFSTAEDTLLAKLQRYRQGNEVSERQWRDVLGILRVAGQG